MVRVGELAYRALDLFKTLENGRFSIDQYSIRYLINQPNLKIAYIPRVQISK